MAQGKKIEVDLKLVHDLGTIDCTNTEAAAVLGMDVTTICKRKDIQAALAKGRETGKASLRRVQWNKALGTREVVQIDAQGKRTTITQAVEPNVAMLIWLGKQRLNQSERAIIGTSDLPALQVMEMLAPHPVQPIAGTPDTVSELPGAAGAR